MWVPHSESCTAEWVAGCRDHDPLIGTSFRKCQSVVGHKTFLRRERWIDRQAQVGACTFQIRRDCESSTENGLATECGRRPRESDARLEGPPAVVSIVEATIAAFLTRYRC